MQRNSAARVNFGIVAGDLHRTVAARPLHHRQRRTTEGQHCQRRPDPPLNLPHAPCSVSDGRWPVSYPAGFSRGRLGRVLLSRLVGKHGGGSRPGVSSPADEGCRLARRSME